MGRLLAYQLIGGFVGLVATVSVVLGLAAIGVDVGPVFAFLIGLTFGLAGTIGGLIAEAR